MNVTKPQSRTTSSRPPTAKLIAFTTQAYSEGSLESGSAWLAL